MVPDDSEVDRPLCQALCTEVHTCTIPALTVTGEQCSNSWVMLYNSNEAGFIVKLWMSDASMVGREVWVGWRICNFKSVHWCSTEGMWSINKCKICYADCTVLHLNVNRPSQFSLHNLNTVDCTHKLTVLWEFKLTRQANIDQNFNSLLNSTWRHIKSKSTAFQVKLWRDPLLDTVTVTLLTTFKLGSAENLKINQLNYLDEK